LEREVAYIHPLFDGKIGKFVEKAYKTPNLTAVFLLPASTHTKYFHEYMYKNPNCEVRVSSQTKQGFCFGTMEAEMTPTASGILNLSW